MLPEASEPPEIFQRQIMLDTIANYLIPNFSNDLVLSEFLFVNKKAFTTLFEKHQAIAKKSLAKYLDPYNVDISPQSFLQMIRETNAVKTKDKHLAFNTKSYRIDENLTIWPPFNYNFHEIYYLSELMYGFKYKGELVMLYTLFLDRDSYYQIRSSYRFVTPPSAKPKSSNQADDWRQELGNGINKSSSDALKWWSHKPDSLNILHHQGKDGRVVKFFDSSFEIDCLYSSASKIDGISDVIFMTKQIYSGLLENAKTLQ